jgi:hypothetical protein
LKFTWSVAVASVVVVLFGGGAARADAPPEFARGAEFFSLRAAYQNERTGEDISLASVVAGAGYYALDNAAIELQFVGYRAHDKGDSAGAGANVLGRYHFLNFDRFSIYGDVLGGIFYLCDDFPTGGTAFNFTYGGGPGLSIRLRDGLHLDGGVRFQHVSNVFIAGRDRNPIFNSFGGYVGVMWSR